MSCDWRVWCVECESEHYFCDANHQVELMRHIVAAAPSIVDLHRRGLFASGLMLTTSYGGVDTAWFAAHAGHQLVPRDEYGRIDGECGERVDCGECGTMHHCRRASGHKGDHSRKPDVEEAKTS